MLSENGVIWLSRELMATAEAMGQTITPNSAGLMAADLSTYTKGELSTALHRTRVEGRGRLSLNMILEQLDRVCGRYGAEEAWALAVSACDESKTVVWNNEVSEAWWTVTDMARRGDLIGARMAFKQAYERITQEARTSLRKPEPLVAIGWSDPLRIEAVTKAYEKGLLPLEQAQSVLAGKGVVLKGATLVALEAPNRGPAVSYTKEGVPFKLDKPAETGVLQHLLSGPAQVAPIDPALLSRLTIATRAARERGDRRRRAQVRLDQMTFNKQKQDVDGAVRRYLERNPKAAAKLLKDGGTDGS